MKIVKSYKFLINQSITNQWIKFVNSNEKSIMQLPSYQFKKFPDSTANRLHNYNLMKYSYDFINNTKAIINNISSLILKDKKKWITCWANILTYNQSLGEHSHDEDIDQTLSGVLFLSKGSELVFTKKNETIIPKPGLGILFPPSWKHCVKTHYHHYRRFSLAFDIRKKRKTKLWTPLE